MKLEEISKRLGLPISGPLQGDVEIHGTGGIEDAGPGEISYLADTKLLHHLATTLAGALICTGEHAAKAGAPCLLSDEPAADFARCTQLFARRALLAPGVHPTAAVASSARLGANVRIGAHVTVGERCVLGDDIQLFANTVLYDDVEIGAGTIVHANCTLRERVRVGSNCILHPGVILGSDGFGFAKANDGHYEKIEQTGTVVVEDDVEIGSGTTIDRATFAETRIGAGTKIDNLVQIGHNCIIGPNTILCAQVGIAGSTVVGSGVTLAGQVGVAGHLTIGDGVVAIAQTGIPSSIEAGRVISGAPAVDLRTWLKTSAAFAKLPELIKSVRRLEGRVAAMEGGDSAAETPRSGE